MHLSSKCQESCLIFKINTLMDGAMQGSFATALFSNFLKASNSISNKNSSGPGIASTPWFSPSTFKNCDETWPPEINGVALSLLQLCYKNKGIKFYWFDQSKKPRFFARARMSGHVTSHTKILQFGWPQYLKVSKAFEKLMLYTLWRKGLWA